MDQNAADGVWIVGPAAGAPALERLLKKGATPSANVAACFAQLAQGDGAGHVDAVLLRVPATDVLSELHLLKEDPWLRDVPVLVILPAYDDALVTACTRAGAFQCVVEPVSQELCDAVIEAARVAQLAARPLTLDPQQIDKVALSFRTPSEAEGAARFLSAFCPQRARQELGIAELLLNAVEHGNLAIGGEHKARLLEANALQDEIFARLQDPRYASRRARVILRRFRDHVEICCEDEGEGFDWRRSTYASLDNICGPRGRGIALARKLAFDSLDYFGCGNRLAARVDFDRLVDSTHGPAPVRFERALGRDRTISHALPEAERIHIHNEAQRLQRQKIDDDLLHEEALLAAKLLGGRKACLGLLTPDGCLRAFMIDTCGERDVQLFSSAEKLPELWSRVLSLEAFLIVNEPRAVAALGLVQQSVLVPIRHRLAHVGFLHVAESGADWTPLDAKRLEELAQQFAPLLAARTIAELASRQARSAAAEQVRAMEDQEAARYLVGCLLREGCMAEPGIRHYATSLEVFNGDIALAARLPSGGLRWMLGDFVGHGLSAAIGGIPVASIFYATASKGVPLIEVVVTMNGMLRDVLPPGYFCAAMLLELVDGRLRYWNGGMPPGLLRSADSNDVRELPSGDLPLGIVGAQSLDLSLQTIDVKAGDRVLCYSDGLIEAASADGVLFGIERAIRAYAETEAEDAFERLSSAFTEFRGVVDASDDLSIVEVTVGVADIAGADECQPACAGGG